MFQVSIIEKDDLIELETEINDFFEEAKEVIKEVVDIKYNNFKDGDKLMHYAAITYKID